MSLAGPVRLVDDTVVRLYHWDRSGRYIELAGPEQGDITLLEGLGGIYFAPIIPVEIKTARLPGGIFVTVRIEKREFELPVLVEGDNSVAWQHNNNRIVQMLSPYHESLLVIQTLPWGPRWIKIRRVVAPDDAFVEDPTYSRNHIWNFKVVAYDPDWQSKAKKAVWVNKSGSNRGDLRIAYTGTRPSFPKWSGNASGAGTLWDLQDGPNGQWNPLPAMAAAEQWVVDSHPMSWQLRSNLVANKWESLQRGFTQPVDKPGEYVFGARLAKGGNTATVGMILQQRHEFPWG